MITAGARIWDFGMGDSNKYFYLLEANSTGVMEIDFATQGSIDNTSLVSSTTLTTGTWYHIVVFSLRRYGDFLCKRNSIWFISRNARFLVGRFSNELYWKVRSTN